MPYILLLLTLKLSHKKERLEYAEEFVALLVEDVSTAHPYVSSAYLFAYPLAQHYTRQK